MSQATSSKYSKTRIVVVAVVCAVTVAAITALVAYFRWSQSNNRELDFSIQPTDAFATNSSNTDWITYRDTNVGYSFQYPPDWKIRSVSTETNVIPKENQDPVTFQHRLRYLTLVAPNGDTFDFGVRRAGERVTLTNRVLFFVDPATGYGGGPLPGMAVNVGPKLTHFQEYRQNDKVKEFFIADLAGKDYTLQIDDYEIWGEFKKHYPLSDTATYQSNYEQTDLRSNEIAISAILTTLQFSGASKEASVDEMNQGRDGWQVYSSSYGYTFYYPQDWQVVNLSDPKAGVALRSPGYVSPKDGDVALEGEIYVNRLNNPRGLTPEQLFNTFDDGSRLWFSRFAHEDIRFDQNRAVYFRSFTEGELTRSLILIPGYRQIVALNYVYHDDTVRNVFEAIASTMSYIVFDELD